MTNAVSTMVRPKKATNKLLKLTSLTWEDLETYPFPPRKPIIDPILHERQVGMIYAPTGVGKTWFSLSLAAAAASGNGAGFLGMHSVGDGMKVLLLDGEMDTQDLQERIALVNVAINADEDAVRKNLIIYSRQHQAYSSEFADIVDERWQNDILGYCEANEIKLIVLDNFSTLTASMEDENSATKVAKVNSMLLKAKQAGVTCLLVHHSNKGGSSYRGSSILGVTLDLIIALQRPDQYTPIHGETAFSLLFEKVRGVLPKAMTMGKTVVFKGDELGAEWKEDDHPATQAQLIRQMLESLRFISQKELAEHMGLSEGAISKKLAQAVAAGVFTLQEKGMWFDKAKRVRAAGEEGEVIVGPWVSEVEEEDTEGDHLPTTQPSHPEDEPELEEDGKEARLIHEASLF